MGNAQQLTAAATDRKTWQRTVLYGAGMVSMLLISMAASLSLWIALPWAFLDWNPTLVTSGSMQPLVSPGDVVMIRSAGPEELVVNAVVLYDRPDTGRVLHRIVEQLPDGTFITRGDANTSDDSGVLRAGEVEGVAVLAVPWIGRPSLWLAEGRTAAVASTALVLVTALGLAPRAFDPAYDPWAAGKRVSPATVLLARTGGSRDDRRADGGHGLLPGGLHAVVLDRLAAQTATAHRRTSTLVEGLS